MEEALCGGLLADFAGLDDDQQGEPVVCASSTGLILPSSLDQQSDGLHER